MKYNIQEHLKPRGLMGISDEQIEQHWHLYEAYVKNTNELLGEIETGERGSREWGELKRRLGFEFNGMVLHEYYFGNLAAGATLSPGASSRRRWPRNGEIFRCGGRISPGRPRCAASGG